MKKTLYNLSNTVEWIIRKLVFPGTGLLHHKKDNRDIAFGGTESARVEALNDYGYQFRQNPFNTCVFASRELGRSHQDGVRWSVRWMVKVARKQGMIKGDGYSYLRAANDIAYKIGRIPYVLMPDETNGMTWDEYSRWTNADEKLLAVAKKYALKPHGLKYREVRNDSEANAALSSGHIIYTAVNWYSAMNSPQPPNFLLRWVGRLIGGHAILFNGVNGSTYKNPQTFGEKYGDNGSAYTNKLIPNIIAGAYVEDHYPTELLADMVATYYSGYVVRDVTAPECYVIEGGKKRHIKTMEEYFALGGTHHTVAKEIINLIPNA